VKDTTTVLQRLIDKLESNADNCATLALENPGIEGIRFNGRMQGYRSAILTVKHEIALLHEV